jgi:hypothetical protein
MLMAVAGVLAVVSVASFLIGGVLLAVGIARSGHRGGGGGLLSGLAGSSGSAPEGAGFSDGHPVGLYLMTRYWMATHTLEKAVWYFTGDGHVYVNPEGFSAADLGAHKAQQGTVKAADGDTMTVQWSDGQSSTSKIERDSSGFAWDMGIFVPVTSFSSASDLVGRWEGGESLSTSSGTSSVSKTLELHEDGTFTREAVAALESKGEGSRATAGSQGSTAGTWNLDGYTLTLTFANGQVARGITFPFADDKDPSANRFYFAGTMYKKQS